MHTYRIIVQTVEDVSSEKDDRKYRRRVRLQHAQRVQLTSQRAILYRFVDSRDRMKTLVWTRIVRCVFDDKENALVWTRQQQIKQVLVTILFAKCHETVVNWREQYFRKIFINSAMSMIAICDSHDYNIFLYTYQNSLGTLSKTAQNVKYPLAKSKDTLKIVVSKT